jgi:hypothetical protein
MSRAGVSHLPFSPLLYEGGFFSGTPFSAVLAGRGGAGFPVTLHRTCLRLCACPVLAAGDSLRSAACGSSCGEKKKKKTKPNQTKPKTEFWPQAGAAGASRPSHMSPVGEACRR